jgi:hypothetical protein
MCRQVCNIESILRRVHAIALHAVTNTSNNSATRALFSQGMRDSSTYLEWYMPSVAGTQSRGSHVIWV